MSDSDRPCSVARTSGRGSEVGRDGFGGGLSPEGRRRLKPQSFVTSHQKEYNEFTRAANSLRWKISATETSVWGREGRQQFRNIPKPEKCMLPVPRLVFDVIALFLDEVRDHDPLSGGEEDDGEGRRVFDRVEEWPSTLVRGSCPFDQALSETHKIGHAIRTKREIRHWDLHGRLTREARCTSTGFSRSERIQGCLTETKLTSSEPAKPTSPTLPVAATPIYFHPASTYTPKATHRPTLSQTK